MTERAIGDPLSAFSCPKCAAISIQPRLRWVKNPGEQFLIIYCDDCGYGERRPTADAALADAPPLAALKEQP